MIFDNRTFTALTVLALRPGSINAQKILEEQAQKEKPTNYLEKISKAAK